MLVLGDPTKKRVLVGCTGARAAPCAGGGGGAIAGGCARWRWWAICIESNR